MYVYISQIAIRYLIFNIDCIDNLQHILFVQGDYPPVGSTGNDTSKNKIKRWAREDFCIAFESAGFLNRQQKQKINEGELKRRGKKTNKTKVYWFFHFPGCPSQITWWTCHGGLEREGVLGATGAAGGGAWVKAGDDTSCQDFQNISFTISHI